MTPPDLPGWTHVYSGKVRDLYERSPSWEPSSASVDPGDAEPVSSDLLVVASDRISAYDHVLDTPIPDKGRVLTSLSLWWFERLADVVENHVVSLDVPPEVSGRAMVVQRLDMYPVECVARGYLAGSGLAEYRAGQSVCGIALPPGLLDGSRLPEPIFTPATKAALGAHDENVDLAHVERLVGVKEAHRLQDLTLEIYKRAEDIARSRGIVLADTKFEFGRTPDGDLVLADEVLTPDSSRFWPADFYAPGRAQQSFDKQFVRDWLTSPESGWERTSDAKPPPLPAGVVERTRQRYVEAYRRLTGRDFL